MAYSSGTFSRLYDWTTDRDAGVKIRADRMDAEMDGMATGLSTAVLKDGTQTTTATVPFAFGISIVDNKAVTLGTNSDYTIQYDETTRDSLMVTSNVEGAVFSMVLAADQGDDAGDEWKIGIADGGVLTLGNDINSAHTYVAQLTLTPNSTVASSTTAVAGNLTVGDNLSLVTDSAVLKFGADNDTTLTHTDGTGLTLNSTNKLCFNDASQFIQGSSATVLSLGATDEIDLTATAVDLNGTLDVSGNAQFSGTLTVGVDDTGKDVKFFGATSGKYMEWDESADQLDVTGSLDVTGNSSMVGTLTVGVDDTGHDVKFFGATSGKYMEWDESADQLDVTGSLDVTGNTSMVGTLTIGADDSGHDVIFYGDTASANMTWDTSADDLILNGAAGLVVPDGQLTLGSTAVSATASEINLIDGGTARGTTSVASGDGILINDGGTMRMTNVDTVSTYFSSHNVGGGNIVTTGALDSGSITSGFGAIDNGTSGIRTNTFTAETSIVPSANDGATLGTASLGFADLFLADGGVIKFGDDQDVTLTHSADSGLILKHANTADDKFPILTLQTGDTDIAVNDSLGRIAFQAPDEGAGTDAILVAASIDAISEGDFSASNNATTLDFQVGASAASRADGDGARLRLTSAGELHLKPVSDTDGNYPIIHLQSPESAIETDDPIGEIQFSPPDESSGTDAILVSASIQARAESAFGSGTNATSLDFKTASSEAAATKMTVNSGGQVLIGTSTGAGYTNRLLTVGDTSDSFSALEVRTSTSGTGHIMFSDSAAQATGAYTGYISYDHSDNYMAFHTNEGVERVKINSLGFVKSGGGYGYLGEDDAYHEFNTSQQSYSCLVNIMSNASRDGVGLASYQTVSHSNTNAKFIACYSSYPGGSADLEFYVRADGNVYADNSFNASGADYAELFEWKDGNSSSEDRVGYSVVLDGNQIRKATSDDSASSIIGVISGNPSVVGDADGENWNGQYLKDDYNRYTYKDSELYQWTEKVDEAEQQIAYYKDSLPDDVTVPSDATTTKVKVRNLNPDYDVSKKDSYERREDRKEWSYVGMMGKLRMLKGQPTGDRWIKMRDISDTVEEWLVR